MTKSEVIRDKSEIPALAAVRWWADERWGTAATELDRHRLSDGLYPSVCQYAAHALTRHQRRQRREPSQPDEVSFTVSPNPRTGLSWGQAIHNGTG